MQTASPYGHELLDEVRDGDKTSGPDRRTESASADVEQPARSPSTEGLINKGGGQKK